MPPFSNGDARSRRLRAELAPSERAGRADALPSSRPVGRPSQRRAAGTLRTRRSLISRIKDAGNQESWREFYDTYRKFVYGAARRAGLTDAEAQDVVQETFCQVAKSIPQFRYDPAVGSFKNWLLHTTGWHVAEQFRARARGGEPLQQRAEADSRTSLTERIPDPRGCVLEEMYEETWKETIREAALKRVREQVKPKQYQAFSLYGLQGRPVSEVAALLGMTANQVYLAKFRIGKLVAEEVKRLEREPG